jgi:putative transposase
VARQCELLDLPRSTAYYRPAGETPENLALMQEIDALYTKWPFYGSRKLAEELGANRKRIQRLMRVMGIEAIYPKRRTTRPAAGHKIYPYLLRNVAIVRPNQVWSTDITYRRRRLWIRYSGSQRLSGRHPARKYGNCLPA